MVLRFKACFSQVISKCALNRSHQAGSKWRAVIARERFLPDCTRCHDVTHRFVDASNIICRFFFATRMARVGNSVLLGSYGRILKYSVTFDTYHQFNRCIM